MATDAATDVAAATDGEQTDSELAPAEPEPVEMATVAVTASDGDDGSGEPHAEDEDE